MKLIRIYNRGEVINERLYEQLKVLDARVFYGCGNKFLKNRDWWVIERGNVIIAYCGCWYNQSVCMFNRAWVHPNYRGQGIQTRMIKARLKAAKEDCTIAITYTTIDNPKSANNLIKAKFKLYIPSYQYAGADKIYFSKHL